MTGLRRFPPPWTLEDHNNAPAALFFIVHVGDINTVRGTAANLMTRDESAAHSGQHREAAGIAAATEVGG
jgi:hypothetical protein